MTNSSNSSLQTNVDLNLNITPDEELYITFSNNKEEVEIVISNTELRSLYNLIGTCLEQKKNYDK